MQYRHILCPVDGNEPAEDALDHAAYLAKTTGAKLTLLNVVEKWYRSSHLVTDSRKWEEIHDEWLRQGKEALNAKYEKIKGLGLKDVDLLVRDGDAAHEIIATAVENRADLIVMATRHYSPMGKIFMGSVVDRVTKRTPCPVLWIFV